MLNSQSPNQIDFEFRHRVSIWSFDFEFRLRLRISISSFDLELRFRVSTTTSNFEFRFRVSFSSFNLEFRFRISTSNSEFPLRLSTGPDVTICWDKLSKFAPKKLFDFSDYLYLIHYFWLPLFKSYEQSRESKILIYFSPKSKLLKKFLFFLANKNAEI